MWALINRARLNPTGEGIALNEGLPAGTLSATSRQPVALNERLGDAADLHSTNMINRDFFAHNDPTTLTTPQGRANNAGYSGGVGENISWSGTSAAITDALSTQLITEQHQSLFWDLNWDGRGHRLNILDDRYQEVGVGQAIGQFTFTDKTTGQLRTLNASMVTQDFGIPSSGGQFLTGITYNDNDGDQFYDVGEARSGVTVTTTAGTVVSGAAGSFSKAITAGVQTISFSGGGLPATISASITVAAGRNALVDLVGTNGLETSVSLTALSGVVKIVGLGNIGLTLVGNALDNTIVSALGNDTINGGDGIDTAVYSGARASYTVTNNNNGTWTVSGREGTDTLTAIEKIQFSDQTLTIGTVTPANRAPVATINDKSLQTNQTANIAGWVSYSDADGDAAVQYQIVDNGTAANSGALIGPNGAVVAAGTPLTVTAAQLANVLVRGGSVAGSETMQIRAFDGKDWGAWDSFVFTTTTPPVQNRAPVATINDKSLQTNQTANIAGWVSYSDADGDAAVQYQIVDNGTAANSGALIGPNGAVVAAGTPLTVTAAQLANVLVRGGSVAGSETMQIRAFDGKDWGAWDSFKFTTTAPAVANRAPVATIDDKSLKVNQWAKVADWLKYSDADGNAAVQYQFVDKYAPAASGYLWADGIGQVAANQVLTVNAADIGNVWVRGAQGGGWENMQVRAFDGTDWGAWDTFKVTTLPNAAPVATINDFKVKANQWTKIADVLKYTDKNGDAAVQYQFMDLYDNAGGTSGYFWTPDNAHHAANAVITVNAADIGNVWVRGAQGAGWENMQVRVFDGMSWGAWDKFKITTVANVAPVATMPDVKVSKNEWVQASTLLKTKDANGDAITHYQFVDQFAPNGSAYFYTPDNPHHAGNEVFTVSAAELSNVWIRGAEVAGWDNMQVRAYDGEAWGAWDSFKFTTINNSAPVVDGDDIDLAIGLKVAARSLFSAIDLDPKDKITQYQFYDDNADADSGYFSQGKKVFAADTIFTVSSANLAKLDYTAGSAVGSDLLWVRAFDGDIWSDWHKFDAHTII
jgi:transcription elongation GreA/GreB family factor